MQYAEKIRLFLEEHFNTIHVLSFKEKMFPEIEQETCLVYLTNECKHKPCIKFKIYTALNSNIPEYCSTIERNKPLKKWTNAILSDEDIDLLGLFERKYKRVSEVCDASPGIVTGANSEFILTRQQVDQLKCQMSVLVTIHKSSMLNGIFILTGSVIEKLAVQENKIYLLNLSKEDSENISPALYKYLEKIGNKENTAGIRLKDRYKCKTRKPWYGIPIVRNGDIFFFKRFDKLPRICINEANIYTTDIAYNMRLNPEYNKESLAFCFYNSLTLAQCEYYGRYYAGGVLELTPSEFKKLTIPYFEISKNDIKKLSKMIEINEKIDVITEFVNSKTIEKDYNKEKIAQLDKIRIKLMQRRLSKHKKQPCG